MTKPKREHQTAPLISICCTTYNIEQQIEQTIEGFLSQKVDLPFEIIFHDDASSDQTPKILKKYQESYPEIIHTVLQKKNQYVDRGIGLGQIFADFMFPVARGQYIAMCDGDDYWTDPHKLQKQIDCLREHPESSACITNATILNEIEDHKRPYHTNLERGPVSVKKILLNSGGVYPTSSLLFRKEALLQSKIWKHLYEYSTELAGDTILIFALSEQGDIFYLDEEMSIYRRWNSGIFSSIEKEPEKIAARQSRQTEGYLKLMPYIQADRRKLLKRKISVESLFVIRKGSKMKRFKYFKHLSLKEVIKLITGLNNR